MSFRAWMAAAAAVFLFHAHSPALELRGRVVDRATLGDGGAGRGIPGVQVSAYEGKKLLGSTVTNSHGQYRFKKLSASKVRVAYRGKDCQPATLVRRYVLTADTAGRDVYLDKPPMAAGVPTLGPKPPRPNDEVEDRGRLDLYYRKLAAGMAASVSLPPFFREDGDSAIGPGVLYEAGDSSAEFRGVLCELLWAEFLSQERPVETRVYLAHALKPVFDSLKWGRAHGMERYLEPDPEGLERISLALREGLRDPRKLPAPKDARKHRVPAALAGDIMGRYFASAGLRSRDKKRFLAAWRKAWPKDPGEWEWNKAGDAKAGFKAREALDRVLEARPECAAALYLRAKALFAAGEFPRAAEEAAQANKQRSGYPAARHLEAMALMKQGRDQEAVGRLQALKESPDPLWKAKAYHGLALIDEKEQRHSEAAANLWKAVRLVPDPATVDLLASASLPLSNHAEVEKLLQELAAREGADPRLHYWMGRYAEAANQPGVAEGHYQKALAAAPTAEVAEALGSLYAGRDEHGAAIAMLEPVKEDLSPAGHRRFAESLLHAGRAADAAREFAAVYAADKSAENLGHYAEALLRMGRADEAVKAIAAFPDPFNPAARFALAKIHLANNEPAKARRILDELAKRHETNPEFHFHLGHAHYLERSYGKAKSSFDAALRYRADYLDAVYYAGLALVKTGRPDAARDFFNELAQRSADEWKARGWLGMGYSWAAERKPEAAENYFQKSLEAKASAEAAGALALSLRRLGAPAYWEAHAKKAYELDPRHPLAMVAQAEVLVHQGKKMQALKLLQKGVETNPTSCELKAGLARGQYLSGAYQASRATSAAAISQCSDDPELYFYAASSSDKLQNRKEAEDYFKAYRRAGGDERQLPPEYR